MRGKRLIRKDFDAFPADWSKPFGMGLAATANDRECLLMRSRHVRFSLSSLLCRRLGTVALLLASLGHGRADDHHTPSYMHVDQGELWTDTERSAYYQTDQGSRMMPYAWLAALKQPSGRPFLDDALTRYGYLAYRPSLRDDLPLGFTLSADGVVGLNCAACHAREIHVGGQRYRIDGAPALSDIQRMMVDIDVEVSRILGSDSAFKGFADAVLGAAAPTAARQRLRNELQDWYLPYATIVERGLPAQPWGPGRLDAIGMIFNRLTGLDIGPAPSYIIAENIVPADAPARYPFLWNAPRQDYTQWPGFSANGNEQLGLARNLGEVYGVFAIFHPQAHALGPVDFLRVNSANFEGLTALEALVRQMGAPVWPWPLDATKRAAGEAIFNRPIEQGGCVGCHGVQPGEYRSDSHDTWATPILDVGTDRRAAHNALRSAISGALTGVQLPDQPPIQPVDSALNLLSVAVSGTLLQLAITSSSDFPSLPIDTSALRPSQRAPAPSIDQPSPGSLAGDEGEARYEARVLHGIWAAAPYLHNGSVPTLRELLTPSALRVHSFAIGPDYDIDSVGIAALQPGSDARMTATGCDQRSSGNSNCGHDYGTWLSPTEKDALLEYLKSL